MEEFVHDRAQRRFEAWVDGTRTGEIAYALLPQDGAVVADFLHTYVDDSARGTGLAGRLARFAFEQVRADGEWTIRPTCPYVTSWVKRHPEYADLITR